MQADVLYCPYHAYHQHRMYEYFSFDILHFITELSFFSLQRRWNCKLKLQILETAWHWSSFKGLFELRDIVTLWN